MNYKSKDYKILKDLFLESEFEDSNFEYSGDLENVIENLIDKNLKALWDLS